MANAHGPNRPSRLEAVLGLFAEVKPGEGLTAVLLFANVFLILTAYYVLKVVREALTIGGVEIFGLPGDEIKAYLPAVMAVLLVGIVPAYGYLASKVDRVRLIKTTTAFVVVCLVGFWLWGSATGVGTAIGLTFYVWIGIVSVFLIAQFWSFANDIYSESQGKRLFAVIAIGQSLGAWVGPNIAKLGANYTFTLPLVSAGMFFVCLLLYIAVNRREERSAAETGATVVEEPLAREGGFQLVFKTKYLLAIAVMILITNVVNTTGEYILGNAAKTYAREQVTLAEVVGAEAAASIEAGAEPTAEQSQALKNARSSVIGRFYGDFFAWVNLLGLLIQMFAVSRIFKYFGVRTALFVLPVIAFGGYASIGLIGGLFVLRLAKTAENATDYSLQNTVKQALFLPTSREAKYKAKAAIDTFFVRFGDAASAALVAFGLHTLAFDARSFARVNVALCLVWIALNVAIAREHRKLVPDDRSVQGKKT
jgi:AAA family ATP:ADP antiporter